MDEQTLVSAALLVELAGVAFRLRRLAAHPRDWAERAHLAVWAFGALGMAAQLAPVYATIDRLSGIPNLALLVCATLIFTSGWWVHIFTCSSRGPVLSSGPRSVAAYGSCWSATP